MDRSLEDNMPIYMQIMNRIRDAIASGELAAGDKVPSVREFASEFEVNPNTMQKALSELERSGLVYSLRTSGRYITEDADLLEKLKKEQAYSHILEFMEKMRQLGFSDDETLSLTQKIIKEDPKS